MNRNFATAVMMAFAFAMPFRLAAVTAMRRASELTADQIGEFVSLAGTADNFRQPRSPKEPYSFILTDAAGGKIRVCAWADIMQTVPHWQSLATGNTPVTLTAEVADYNGRLELHIQDGAEVSVAAAATSDTAQLTPPPFSGQTSAPR